MDLPNFEHNPHQSQVSHDFSASLTQHDHPELLSDPNLGVHPDPFAASGVGVYEPHHSYHSFDGQTLADYHSPHADGFIDHQYSQIDHFSHSDHALASQGLGAYHPHHIDGAVAHQYTHVDHNSHWEHVSQRSGSEKASDLLSQANELEKKAHESYLSSQNHSEQADWHRQHNNPSDVASHGNEAQKAMAESEKYRAEAQKLRDQSSKI